MFEEMVIVSVTTAAATVTVYRHSLRPDAKKSDIMVYDAGQALELFILRGEGSHCYQQQAGTVISLMAITARRRLAVC